MYEKKLCPIPLPALKFRRIKHKEQAITKTVTYDKDFCEIVIQKVSSINQDIT